MNYSHHGDGTLPPRGAVGTNVQSFQAVLTSQGPGANGHSPMYNTRDQAYNGNSHIFSAEGDYHDGRNAQGGLFFYHYKLVFRG